MTDILREVAETGRITAGHVQALRRSLYNDGVAERGEVERLFAIDEAAEERDEAWNGLFAEAVVDHLVYQMEPAGYVDEANADWLIERIARDGLVRTASEIEVLVKVLEKAERSPERLSAFALRQVKAAVVEGDGPLARGGTLVPGRIGRDEVELVRRILFAFGGHGGVAVSRPEAEVLFDINDETAEADNDPAWSDLFVKAVANCMMAASGYAAPSREEALRRAEWLDAPSGGVGDVFARMAAGGLRGMFDAYRGRSGEDAWAARNARRAAEAAGAEAIGGEEAAWIAGRIGRDGALHENERTLLRFIRDEAPSVHPSLQSLLNKAA